MALQSAAPTPSPERLQTDSWDSQIRYLFEYWRSIAPAGALPGRQHFDPMAVVGVLPFVWLLDVQREPFRLRYRLAGTAITQAHRREVTGLWFDDAHPELAAQPGFMRRYQDVVATGVPSWRHGSPFMKVSHKRVENLVLPLARDGSNVDMLLCITRFCDPIWDDTRAPGAA